MTESKRLVVDRHQILRAMFTACSGLQWARIHGSCAPIGMIIRSTGDP